MSGLLIIFLFVAIMGAMLIVHFIDSKLNLNFFAWLNGENVNPFEPKQSRSKKASNNENIDALKRRIETLETIVTEPAYELNKKINQL
ncbi:hypothetical protein OPS25_10620 [Alteromonas ponticola]|uniref:Uncharacterized protein n=1 Tax=Alteromonas aquimaris TaxID=2998417 RepID=A0ABT3PA52_9ALTE|nr:hypothetical protein [Alteromonas aquimaris]MCW8108946.1 hypothetical protein [Alteromonas aquimaris]